MLSPHLPSDRVVTCIAKTTLSSPLDAVPTVATQTVANSQGIGLHSSHFCLFSHGWGGGSDGGGGGGGEVGQICHIWPVILPQVSGKRVNSPEDLWLSSPLLGDTAGPQSSSGSRPFQAPRGLHLHRIQSSTPPPSGPAQPFLQTLNLGK